MTCSSAMSRTDTTSVAVGDGYTEDLFDDEDPEGRVKHCPVAHVGNSSLAGVDEVVDRLVVGSEAAVVPHAVLRVNVGLHGVTRRTMRTRDPVAIMLRTLSFARYASMRDSKM